MAHRWVAFIEAEQPQISQASAHQYPMLLQAFQLALGHVESEAKGVGDSLCMPLSVALQEQQHAGGRPIAEQRLQHRVHRRPAPVFHPFLESLRPHYGCCHPGMGWALVIGRVASRSARAGVAEARLQASLQTCS